MEGYSFHSGTLRSEPSFLFNQVNHLRLQIAEGWRSFYVLAPSGVTAAFVHFHIAGTFAQSPYRAPFGSVEVNSIPPNILFDFLSYVESELRVLGIKRILIKDAPALFRPAESSLLHAFLINQGYLVKNAEVSAVILVEGANARFNPWEQRKLKQGIEGGLKFVPGAPANWNELYQFIAGCRRSKDFELSMTEQELGRIIETFPDRFRFFCVYQEQTLAAACIALLIRHDILYTFYFDHHRDFDSLSPAVTLIDGIYNCCRNQGIQLLDLGTSALHGRPNFRLLDFKLHLGAQPSLKLSFEKELRE